KHLAAAPQGVAVQRALHENAPEHVVSELCARFVIPAKAGIQCFRHAPSLPAWMPAFAGMTAKIMHTFFATTAKGMEELLAAELRALGAQAVAVRPGGVAFEGALDTGYRA